MLAHWERRDENVDLMLVYENININMAFRTYTSSQRTHTQPYARKVAPCCHEMISPLLSEIATTITRMPLDNPQIAVCRVSLAAVMIQHIVREIPSAAC